MINFELTAKELGCSTLKVCLLSTFQMLLHLFQAETLLFHFPTLFPEVTFAHQAKNKTCTRPALWSSLGIVDFHHFARLQEIFNDASYSIIHTLQLLESVVKLFSLLNLLGLNSTKKMARKAFPQTISYLWKKTSG